MPDKSKKVPILIGEQESQRAITFDWGKAISTLNFESWAFLMFLWVDDAVVIIGDAGGSSRVDNQVGLGYFLWDISEVTYYLVASIIIVVIILAYLLRIRAIEDFREKTKDRLFIISDISLMSPCSTDFRSFEFLLDNFS